MCSPSIDSKKSLFGCGESQKNGWAARVHMCNSIYKISYEATRPVRVWFPIHGEVQNTPSTPAHVTKGGEHTAPWVWNHWNSLKIGSSVPDNLKYKWCTLTTPVVSWVAVSKTHLAVLRICNSGLLQKTSVSPIWKEKPKLSNYLNITVKPPPQNASVYWQFCQPLVGGEQEHKRHQNVKLKHIFKKPHHKTQALQWRQDIHTDQVVQWARK